MGVELGSVNVRSFIEQGGSKYVGSRENGVKLLETKREKNFVENNFEITVDHSVSQQVYSWPFLLTLII